jgi:hypothetical protein
MQPANEISSDGDGWGSPRHQAAAVRLLIARSEFKFKVRLIVPILTSTVRRSERRQGRRSAVNHRRRGRPKLCRSGRWAERATVGRGGRHGHLASEGATAARSQRQQATPSHWADVSACRCKTRLPGGWLPYTFLITDMK